MKNFFTALMLFAVSCSVTEASSWINTLLSLKNANYIADSSGTITMDGYTFTLHETRSATTAIYRVHLGEFAARESESIGFCRFDIVDAALNDSRITEPLIRYELRDTAAEAFNAPKLSGTEVLGIPQTIINERFLRTARNIRQRALEPNGSPVAVVADTGAAFDYMPGVVIDDAQNIYFEDVKLRTNGANTIPKSYYRDSQWKFVSALNFTNGIYQKVALERTDPNAGLASPIYYDQDLTRPLFGEAGLEDEFVGVQAKGDGLYFFYPNADDVFTNAADVMFTGHSVKVSRPLTATDVF